MLTRSQTVFTYLVSFSCRFHSIVSQNMDSNCCILVCGTRCIAGGNGIASKWVFVIDFCFLWMCFVCNSWTASNLVSNSIHCWFQVKIIIDCTLMSVTQYSSYCVYLLADIFHLICYFPAGDMQMLNLFPWYHQRCPPDKLLVAVLSYIHTYEHLITLTVVKRKAWIWGAGLIHVVIITSTCIYQLERCGH